MWLWPVAATADITLTGNSVNGYNEGDHDFMTALKIVSRPASLNGETTSGEMLAAVKDDNPGIDSVYLQWMMVREGESIQAAINAALPGDTVEIEPGTYNEQVTINKSVKLRGAGIDETILSGAGSGAGITIPYAGQPFSGIEISDLTVTGYEDGILILGTNSNLLVEDVKAAENVRHGIWSQSWNIKNWIFRGVNASDNGGTGAIGRGIWIINGVKEGITIEDGTFNRNRLVGIDISDGSVTGLTVRGNTVIGNGDSGIAVLGAKGPMANMIDGNTVTDNGRFGIEIKNPSGNGQSSGAGSIVVSNNVVSRTEEATDQRDYAGIAVFRRQPVLQYNADQPCGVVVARNTVTGYQRKPSGSTGDGFGIVVEGTNHTVTGNVVTQNDVGIQAQAGNPVLNQQSTDYFDRGDAAGFSGKITQNVIVSNTIGVRSVGVATQVDATRNYWGEAGPGAQISGDVEYFPWALDDTRNASGDFLHLTNSDTDVVVVDDAWLGLANKTPVEVDGTDYYVGVNAFGSIQDAVEAVDDGGTVNVAPGEYAETVAIEDKNGVTVKGSGRGEGGTVIRPDALLSTGMGHKYDPDMRVTVFVNDSTDVTMRDMTIDGNDLGGNAVVFWNASTGSLEGLEIVNCGPLRGAQTGQGIAVDAGSGRVTRLEVNNCDIRGFNKNGIDVVDGNGAATGGGTITVDVTGGSITGAEPTTVIAQNGIMFWERAGGTVGGTVSGVGISGIEYTPDTNEACGVLAYAQKRGALSIEDTRFSGTEVYIGLGAGSSGGIDASSCVFDGVSPAEASFAQLAAIEDRIIHKMDDAACGLVALLPRTVVATPNNRGIQAAIDVASPGDRVFVAAGGYNEAISIAKPLTLRGDPSADRPVVNIPCSRTSNDTSVGVFEIRADDVLVEHLRLVKEDQGGWNNSVIAIPRGGSWPAYTIEYEDITLRDLVVEKGGAGAYIAAGDITIEDCEFLDQREDALFFDAVSGTTNVLRNRFVGSPGSKKAIIFENFSDKDPGVTGTVNIRGNVVNGKNHLFLYNQWRKPENKVDINIADNVVEAVAGDAIAVFDPRPYDPSFDPLNFRKIQSIRVTGNDLSGAPTSCFAVLNIDDPNAVVIDATGNYWGDDAGPNHAVTNPESAGGAVSDNVIYSPWKKTDGSEGTLAIGLDGAYDWDNDEGDVTITGPQGLVVGVVKVNGREVRPTPKVEDGMFSVELEEGPNDIWVEASDATGNVYRGTCGISRDKTAPVTTITPSRGVDGFDGWYKGPTAPTVLLAAEADATIRYRWNGGEWFEHGGPEVELQVPEGESTLEYFSTDATGNEEQVKSAAFKVDTVPPTGSITIAGRKDEIGSREVTITLASADAERMRVSNDAGMSGATWQAFRQEMSWTLTDGYGPKRVYAQFRDHAGNESVVYSDVINYVRSEAEAPPAGPAPAPPAPPVVAGSTTQEVTAETGGTVSLPDDSAQVTLPPAAVEDNVTVTIAPMTEVAEPSPGMVKVGNRVFEITCETAAGEPVRAFSKPIILTFRYEEEELGGASAEDLRVFYWDEGLAAWIAIPSEVDVEAGTVTGVTDHLTVFALMVKPGMPRMPDIKGHWAEAHVLKLVSLGVAGGYPDGTFRPEETITREQFAKMVVVAAGIQAEAVPELGFADAGEVAEWAKGYVAAAVKAGIIKGLDGNRFGPGEAVTRAQVATMLVRALGIEVGEAGTQFTDDAEIPAWAARGVRAAVEKGIVGGFEDGSFRPGLSTTRAQAAKMLSRFMEVRLAD
ncbi:MAG: S-layer homology domain-containing protein [Firmicutes bacterium]|nr:S-layer homology domain-containing protein [Bacillota bacterium]